ncbi:MAG TPA: DUF2304 family protein [Patescibacteria group bacterium]|nr:DUF2304 family protein [Patescibacteria group bacterium]
MIIQIILVATLAAALVLTWRRSRQGALSRLGAFLWSALWIAAAVVVLRPEVASFFANLVGVGRGVDAVLYVSIIALFYLVFRIFLRLDKLDRDITLLVRKVGLAERDARRVSEGDEGKR